MRSFLLVMLIGCGERSPAGSVPSIVDAGAGSGISLPAAGKPPQQTARPLAKDALAKLAALEVAGFTRTVRKLDDGFLDLALVQTSPAIRVSVVIQPCLRCVPMQIDRWRAEGGALRVTIPPDLRDRADTTFEVAATTIGGAPAIWTYQLAWAADKDATPIHDHAVTLYWNDGVNQIRTIAAHGNTQGIDSREAMVGAVGRRDLERFAASIALRYTQAWGN